MINDIHLNTRLCPAQNISGVSSANGCMLNARALYYDFFAGLFLFELLSSRDALLLEQIQILQSSPLEEENIKDFICLKQEIVSNGMKHIVREYSYTFLLPFALPKGDMPIQKRRKGQSRPNPQVMLYLSHYTDGCLNASGLLKARQIVKKSTFRPNVETFKESEEHLGFLLLLMRYLLLSSDTRDTNLSSEVVRELILPLGNAVSGAILERDDLLFYSCVARILRSFLAIESAIL